MINLQILREAIATGNKQKISDILREEDVDLSATDDRGDTFLHLAFRNERSNQAQLIEILAMLLDRGIDINAKNPLGKTVLHLAVERRMRDVIDFCLERNVDASARDDDGNTVAHFAVEEECRKFHSYAKNYWQAEDSESEENASASFVDYLASRGFDFARARNRNDYSALHLACELNLQHVLLALLKRIDELPPAKTSLLGAFFERNRNPDVCFNYKSPRPIGSGYYESRYVRGIARILLAKDRSVDDKILTLALSSAIASHLEASVVRLLLERLSSVDSAAGSESLLRAFAYEFSCWTLRGKASQIEDGMEILRRLIGKGADVNGLDFEGETFAHSLFRCHPCLEMLQLLREGKADFEARTDHGNNFLHLVGQYGNDSRMIDLALDAAGCDVNSTNYKQETPLQEAIVFENYAVAERLVERGARVNDLDKEGRSPLSLACSLGQVRVAEKLVEFGADLSYRDESGKTLMHLAVDSTKTIELLRDNGVDVNAKDRKGKTPLHRTTSADVAKTLFDCGAHVDARDDKNRTPLYYSLLRKNAEVMDELLRCGAEMRDPKIYALTLRRSRAIDGLVFRSVKRHFVKLIAAELLREIPFAPCHVDEDVEKAFEICQLEVETLKDFLIDERTSLYNLLLASRNRRCAYVDLEELRDFVEDGENEKEFPCYYELILGCYNDAATRKPLLEAAIEALNEFAGAPLPDLCTDQIFMYLSNGDLERFVEACENVGD